ncbi:MAG: 1-deoxy-D-xylulose-5-phosphate reductoisomerase [Thermaerobacter sp.]|nr:1-deoxy-D-xylulose-5-phosphate reductoisomerase [Thermaerobacter sp.]
MRLVILGATGSIGQSAYSVWEQHRDEVTVEGLVAHRENERLWGMGTAMNARWVGLADKESAQQLERAHRGEPGPKIVAGKEAILEALGVCDATHVLAAMSGFAGLEPTMTALARGRKVLLANKETLVAAGDLVRAKADQSGADIVPVDSEHSAIFQCLALNQPFRRIVLTCSGGPFRGWRSDELAEVTVEQALRHPNWSMGPKITIDSATLMNKGLEIIEAHYLFRASYDAIDVVIHPESVVHSLVEFVDGATMAQCGYPDMRVPIAVAMAWPQRWTLDVPDFGWTGRTLHFEAPDTGTFRLLRLARAAGITGGAAPAILNAANEVAVASFLAGRIRFLDIADTVEETLNTLRGDDTLTSVEQVIETDKRARAQADMLISRRHK